MSQESGNRPQSPFNRHAKPRVVAPSGNNENNGASRRGRSVDDDPSAFDARAAKRSWASEGGYAIPRKRAGGVSLPGAPTSAKPLPVKEVDATPSNGGSSLPRGGKPLPGASLPVEGKVTSPPESVEEEAMESGQGVTVSPSKKSGLSLPLPSRSSQKGESVEDVSSPSEEVVGVEGVKVVEGEDSQDIGVQVEDEYVSSPLVEADEVEMVEGEEEVEVERVEVRPRREKSAPAPRDTALIEVDEDWESEPDDAALAYRDDVMDTVSKRGLRIVPRDLEIIRFLARYRYAQSVQVARLVKTSDKAAGIRLSKLHKAGLIRKEEITRGQVIWTPLKSGLAIADVDFPALHAGKISIVTMGHELGLANIGVELEIGGDNILNEDGWPFYNRYSLMSNDSLEDEDMLLGENVLTTREIRSGQTRWNANKDRETLIGERDDLLALWEPGERSPETNPDNAFMFAMYSANYGDHIPDMVVARDRNADGSPNSIGIELELSPKPVREWVRILSNYAESNMFGKVYYYTTKKSIADTLKRVNRQEVGLTDEQFKVLRYRPRREGLPFWG